MPSPRMRSSRQFQRGGFGGVHAGGGFVQRQQRGVSGQRARDFEATLIAIGEIARELIGVTRNAAVVEQLVRAAFNRGLFAARARAAQHRAQHARVRAHVTPDHDVFQRGHVGEQADVLERARDPGVRHHVRFIIL